MSENIEDTERLRFRSLFYFKMLRTFITRKGDFSVYSLRALRHLGEHCVFVFEINAMDAKFSQRTLFSFPLTMSQCTLGEYQFAHTHSNRL